MRGQTRLSFLSLVSALLIAIATPVAAYAGTLTVYNDNCTKTVSRSTTKRVTVNVSPQKGYRGAGCTDTYFTVSQGNSKTIELEERSADERYPCKYAHEARGTALGKHDVRGDSDSTVTCRKDWASVCQCTKD